MRPWLDRTGHLSPLKAIVFAALFVPALWVAGAFALGALGGRPLHAALLQMGVWTVRLLFLTLIVTPLRQSLQWPRLISVRRMLGVATFAYAATHLTLYSADQSFNLAKVASEIISRIYLTIGFVALLGLATLAATSTDAMVRRLGARAWRRLHQLVYLIGVLAVTHFFLQSKADVGQPIIMAGLFAWLMFYRVLGKLFGKGGRVPLWAVTLLAPVASLLTALGEALYFWLKVGVSPLRVLDTDLSLIAGIRPAQVVLAITLAFVAICLLRLLAKPDAGWRQRWRQRLNPRPA